MRTIPQVGLGAPRAEEKVGRIVDASAPRRRAVLWGRIAGIGERWTQLRPVFCCILCCYAALSFVPRAVRRAPWGGRRLLGLVDARSNFHCSATRGPGGGPAPRGVLEGLRRPRESSRRPKIARLGPYPDSYPDRTQISAKRYLMLSGPPRTATTAKLGREGGASMVRAGLGTRALKPRRSGADSRR